MFINTRYSTVYSLQKNSKIIPVSNRNSATNIKKVKDSKNSFFDSGLKDAIDNVKTLSDGNLYKTKSIIKSVYESESKRFAIETLNFIDVSTNIEELKLNNNKEPLIELTPKEDFQDRGNWYDSDNFEKSPAYREVVESKKLEEVVGKLKNVALEKSVPKKLFLTEVDKDQLNFSLKKTS